MSKNTKKIAYTLGIVLVLAVVGYFANDLWALMAGADQSAKSESKNQRPPTPVNTATVQRGEVKITTESVGTLKAREQVILTSQVTGLVEDIRFTEGQRVEAGEVLVELDDDQEQAELAEAIAVREEARRQYQRGRELKGSGLITLAQLDEWEAAFKTAAAGVEVAEARLRNHTIKAPFSGLIGLRQISPGSLVTPGTVIANLRTTDPLDLTFGVRSEFLSQLQPGLTVLARAPSLDGQVFRGRLTRVDTDIDPQTRNIQVEAELPNPDGVLKPGLFMTVDLVLETRSDALIIPEEALLLRGQDQYVFVVQDNNQVKRQAVKTGQRRPGEVEIREGLAAGASIVVGGLQKIRDGQQVKPLPAKADNRSSSAGSGD